MTGAPDMEKVITDLEGASNALNNFAQTDDLPTEVDIGLQWLAMQIDTLLVELRNEWDATKPGRGPKLEAVEE